MEYNGSTTLISGITQANNGTYPLVDSEYIQYKDEENVDGSYVSVRQKLDEIEVLNENKLDYAGDSDINSIIPNLFEEKIRITQSSKIDNTLNSDLIIDSIEGNYYQELGEVVPTPDREIPIFSKKINVNGEVVELRSLKESSNLFDIKMYGFEVGLLNNNGILQPGFTTYFTSGYIPIKKSTQYMVGILGLDGYTLTGVFFYDQNYNLVAKTDSKPFTTPANSMYVKFGCTKNGGAVDEINKHAMLVEGTTVPSTYVAPTVRDYKVVDHSNKKSWIERNIFSLKPNGSEKWESLSAINNLTDYFRLSLVNGTKDISNNILNTKFEIGNPYSDDIDCIGFFNTDLRVRYKKFDNNLDGFKNYLKSANLEVIGKLGTPVIEEIPYDENDNSELGESFQDTISPSPTIFSDIEYVDRIEIKTIGKNYFDIEKARNLENWKPSNQGGYSYFKIQVKKGQKYILHYNNILEPGLGFYIGLVNNKEGSNISNWIYHNSLQDLVTNSLSFTAKYDYVSLQISSNSILRALNKLIDLQLEESDIATTYEPYQETAISYQLSKPLLKIGDYTDVINLSDLSRINNCLYEDISNFNIVGGTEYENMKGVYFCIAIPTNKVRKLSTPVICNTISKMTSRFDCNGMGIYGGVNIDINFKDIYITPPYSNAKVKEFFKNVNTKIAYVLKEPTTEPLESGLLEIIKSLKTFSPVTNILIKKIEPTLNCRFNKI